MRAALAFLAVLALSSPALADGDSTLTDAQLQAVVKAHFAHIFVLPYTTVWHFERPKPYRAGSIVMCGQVNYMNSGRTYSGFLPFYAVLRSDDVSESGIIGNKVQDPTGATLFAYGVLCTQN